MIVLEMQQYTCDDAVINHCYIYLGCTSEDVKMVASHICKYLPDDRQCIVHDVPNNVLDSLEILANAKLLTLKKWDDDSIYMDILASDHDDLHELIDIL